MDDRVRGLDGGPGAAGPIHGQRPDGHEAVVVHVKILVPSSVLEIVQVTRLVVARFLVTVLGQTTFRETGLPHGRLLTESAFVFLVPAVGLCLVDLPQGGLLIGGLDRFLATALGTDLEVQ